MQLWLGRDRLDEHRSLYNLLFTMTKHRIYDHFRRRYNLEALRRPLSEFDAVSDEAESPESGLEAEQLRQTIARTVAAMPPQRRTIFALSRPENLSRQEIARRLGVSDARSTSTSNWRCAKSGSVSRISSGCSCCSCAVKERQRGCFREPDAEPDSPGRCRQFFIPALRSLGLPAKKRGDHRSPRPLKQTFRHFPKTSFSTAANR